MTADHAELPERLPWFPCEPGKLLNALAGMKPYVGYTYWIICLRIYEVGGPCPDSLDAIVRRTGYTKRVVSEAMDVLFRDGKLARTPDGLTNPYCQEVLQEMALRRDTLSDRGRTGANARWGKHEKKQRNGNARAMDQALPADAHLQGHIQVTLPLDGGGLADLPRNPEATVAVTKHRRATRALISNDWTVSDHGRQFAKALGFDDQRIDAIRNGFVRYYRRTGKTIADWEAAWEGWCENEVKFAKERAPRGPQGSGRGGRLTFADIARGTDDGRSD